LKNRLMPQISPRPKSRTFTIVCWAQGPKSYKRECMPNAQYKKEEEEKITWSSVSVMNRSSFQVNSRNIESLDPNALRLKSRNNLRHPTQDKNPSSAEVGDSRGVSQDPVSGDNRIGSVSFQY
jgi:hypothetical protein